MQDSVVACQIIHNCLGILHRLSIMRLANSCTESHGGHFEVLLWMYSFRYNSQVTCFRTHFGMEVFDCFVVWNWCPSSVSTFSHTLYMTGLCDGACMCVCRFVSAEVAEELAYRRNILTMSWCSPRACARNIRTIYLTVSTPLLMSLCLFDLSTRKFLVQFTVLRGVNYKELAQDPVTWHTSPLGYISVELTHYLLGFGVKVINYHIIC
jgi:hypothetical protein